MWNSIIPSTLRKIRCNISKGWRIAYTILQTNTSKVWRIARKTSNLLILQPFEGLHSILRRVEGMIEFHTCIGASPLLLFLGWSCWQHEVRIVATAITCRIYFFCAVGFLQIWKFGLGKIFSLPWKISLDWVVNHLCPNMKKGPETKIWVGQDWQPPMNHIIIAHVPCDRITCQQSVHHNMHTYKKLYSKCEDFEQRIKKMSTIIVSLKKICFRWYNLCNMLLTCPYLKFT